VNLLAGATDHITPPEQVFALAGAVSTPAERITRRTCGVRIPGRGHAAALYS
jgi:hypothetical protein